MNIIGVLAVAALGVVGFGTAAHAADARSTTPSAEQQPARPVTSFGYLDKDKDARVSREEAKADWAVAQRFGAADTNGDGYLDEEEFKRLQQQG